MKSLIKLMGFTSAVMLAAFALPANAAKTISLSVTPTTLSTQTTTVSAVISNTGNSNANSFEVDWLTSPYFKVTGASASGTGGSCTTSGLRGAGYSSCTFLKQVPTKTSVTITLTVEVSNQCTSMSIDWYAYAWTGSPGPVSQSFTLQGAVPVTSSPASCSVIFATPPKDTFAGSTITGTALNSAGAPVTVQVLRNGAGVNGVSVALSASSSCATGPDSATTASSGGTQGVAQVVYTAGTATDTCTLTAIADGYGSATSQSFKVVPHGDLGCDSTNNAFGTSSGGLVLSGTRLGNVDDPSPTAVGGATAPACVVVPYVVSATCPPGVTGACTSFVYDPLNQGTHMAFTFHWEWPAEAIPTGGIGAVANTLQLFLNGSTVPLELDLCTEISPAFDGTTFTGLVPGSPSPADQDFNAPGTQAGCLVRRTVKQIGDQIQVTEDAYVQGDYTATRR